MAVRTGMEKAAVRRLVGACVIVVLGAGLVLASGCFGWQLAPPAQAVQELLELRSENSTDTASYVRYVEDTAVADALAQDAASRTDGSPIPDWETPTVESSSETSASVLVVWKPSDRFESWAASTTFLLEYTDGVWIIVDATERSETETATPQP